MFVDRDHPSFDMKMEVLCLLSLEPAPRKLILEDLRIKAPALQSLFNRLIVDGVKGVKHLHQNCLVVDPCMWRHVQHDCDKYMERVYGAKNKNKKGK